MKFRTLQQFLSFGLYPNSMSEYDTVQYYGLFEDQSIEELLHILSTTQNEDGPCVTQGLCYAEYIYALRVKIQELAFTNWCKSDPDEAAALTEITLRSQNHV